MEMLQKAFWDAFNKAGEASQEQSKKSKSG
jgi:hypothetical protein